jgi:hypothetical protein
MMKHIFAALFAVTFLAAQSVDVFDRQEAANARTLGEYQFPDGIDPTQWGISTTGTAAVTYTTIQRTGATDATVFSAMRWEEIR